METAAELQHVGGHRQFCKGRHQFRVSAADEEGDGRERWNITDDGGEA